MIVRLPETKYERDIYDYIVNDVELNSLVPQYDKELKKDVLVQKYSEGDKDIIYDFATQYIPKVAIIDLENIDLDAYIYAIRKHIEKHNNKTIAEIVDDFVRNLKLERKNKIIEECKTWMNEM